MPRGQKSKVRARQKRQQVRSKAQEVGDAQAIAAGEESTSSSTCSSSSVSSCPVAEGASQSSPASSTRQKPQRAAVNTNAAGASSRKPNGNAKSRDKEKASTSGASASTVASNYDHLSRKAGMIVQLMLYKYAVQEPITKAEMLKFVNKRCREHFPEIFRRATERVEMIFGLQLEKIKPTGHSYKVVSKTDINDDGTQGMEGPGNGLLMPLLSVIFLSGDRASEEEIWEFLNILGIFDGKKHFVFGEPRKLITQDLVKEKYLEYRQVPDSDPPCFEFLWGPRAIAEISKLKVLEFLAKVNDIAPDTFPTLYAEALREEKERAAARGEPSAEARGPLAPQPEGDLGATGE